MPTLASLTAIFLKAGNTTFGGGEPTIAALQRELCQRKGWLSPEQFALAFSLGRVTPGTNVLAFCAAAAWMLRGWTGAIAAVVAASAPSAVLSVWLTVAYEASGRNSIAHAAVLAVLAAVVGMMAAAVWLLIKPHCRSRVWPCALAIVACALLLREWMHLSPVQLMALGAVAGAVWKERETE